MTEEPREVSKFIFGIVTSQAEGRINYQTNVMNKKVPVEVIAMQLRAFLAQLEKEYCDTFNQTTNFFREE